MSSNEFDLQKLCLLLDVNNNISQRKEYDALLINYSKLPKYGPSLLTIACNKEGNIPNPISQVAAITLKNYINSNWKFGDDNKMNTQLCFEGNEIIVISNEDKDFIRKNILEGVLYVVEKENVMILKQFNQCVKKILKLDYKEIWQNDFMNFVINCVGSQEQKHIYAGILLFYQLSKIYEFEDSKNVEIFNEALKLVNDKFLLFIDMCKGIKNNVEAMILYKLYKMFLKNFQGSVPSFILNNEVYKNWSLYLVQILKTPIDKNYIEDKNCIFWKLRRICFRIVTRVTQKYKNRDTSNKEHNTFRQNLLDEYIPQYYEIFTIIYTNCNKNQEYIDDKGKVCVYSFYCFLLELSEYKEKVFKLFLENDALLEEIIKDCEMPQTDLDAWVNSPKEYIGQKEEELGMYNTKKFRAEKLIKSFMEYKEKKSKKYIYFDKIYNYLCNAIIKDEQNLIIEENNIKNKLLQNPNNESYLTNPSNVPFCLRKESILFILKRNSDIISKNADSILLIKNLVFPSLKSPCGLLREQSCDFISRFKIKNEELLQEIVKILCSLMEKDPQLPVRLYACIALGFFFEEEIVRNMIKGNIKQILEISLRLMDETDVEQIMDNLQEVVKYFTGESQQYIIELSDYLMKYFMRIVEKENNMEDESNIMDTYTIKNNIVTTFTSFIKYFINNPDIYNKITNHVDALIDYFLKKSDSPESGMDLIEEVLKHSPSNNTFYHIYKFYIPLIQTVIGTEEELTEFKRSFPNQVFTGQGFESILDVAKLVCMYISKDPNTFLNLKDNKGIGYIVYTSKLIESIIEISESRGDYEEAKFCLEIIMTLFYYYKGQMDKLMNDLIEFVLRKIKNGNITDKNLIQFLLNIISICFIYDSAKCLNVLQTKKIIKEIFIFWFNNLNKIGTKIFLKYNLIAICSIIKIDINQQDKLITDNMKQLIEGIFSLTKKLNDKIENDLEEEISDYDDNDEYDENFSEKDENKVSEQVKNIVSGEPTDLKYKIKDEDISDDEIDEEDEAITEFDKINVIDYVKNTLNDVGQNQQMNKIIVESLGDKFQILNEIFNKEEERKAQTKK